MKEGPILFSAAMARAIREGRKTQTRRIADADMAWDACVTGDCEHDDFRQCDRRWAKLAKRGVPGDRLYVRESCWLFGKWYRNGETKSGRPAWRFQAYGERVSYERPPLEELTYQGWDRPGFVFRPSIHVPRWASRTLLELTRVRCELVRQISTEDAIAEGFESREAFLDTFFNLNERAPKNSNPPVWVFDFALVNL